MNFAAPYLRRHRHFLHQRTDLANFKGPAGTFAPGAVPRAYKFPSNAGVPKTPVKFGIVSLGGNIPLSDITKFCSDSGYVKPNLAVRQIAGADTTSDPGGANVENNLDWQMILQAWASAFPTVPCDITVMIGPNSDNGIADAITALVGMGCKVISISWGAARSQWSAASLAYTEAALAAAKGVMICVASGDNSLDDGTASRIPDYPASSIYTWAVGGTALSVDAAGAYVSEKAWGDGKPGDEGGGGGFAVGVAEPPWQVGVVPGSFLGVPSSSANADPNTGYVVYSDGAYGIVGGTSASAPLTAGLFGVVLALGGSAADFQTKLYAARKTCWNDVHLGSNGDPAVIGWDSATGNGSPVGPGIMAALTGVVVVPPPPLPPPSGGVVVGTFMPTTNLTAGVLYKITT